MHYSLSGPASASLISQVPFNHELLTIVYQTEFETIHNEPDPPATNTGLADGHTEDGDPLGAEEAAAHELALDLAEQEEEHLGQKMGPYEDDGEEESQNEDDYYAEENEEKMNDEDYEALTAERHKHWHKKVKELVDENHEVEEERVITDDYAEL